MTVQSQRSGPDILRMSRVAGARAVPWLVLAALGAIAFFWDGLISLGSAWSRPEYSYGPLVPVITTYLALREVHHRPLVPDTGSRAFGLAVFGIAILVGLVGNLAKIPDIITYGFILFVGSVVLILAGTREGLRFWPAWVHLIFMLPLPQFIYLHVSTSLQHLSSVLGVSFIQFAGISVFLDGNIIDLGTYQLQVAEACSGLRYLFPLFSFGWLFAVLYAGPRWHKVVLFLSVIPIAVFMNAFRIGVIGFLVDRFGIEQADGFLHFFEGWAIFIACIAILYFEAWLLWRFFVFGASRGPHTLDFDFAKILRPFGDLRVSNANGAIMTASIAVLAAGLWWQLQPAPVVAGVDRLPLGVFPSQVAEWSGTSTILDRDVERVLAADDYMLADYVAEGQQVDLLMTFYNSQTEGSGIHSPEVCIPSAGWEVARWEQVSLAVGEGSSGKSLRVNRAIIQKGLDRQLVYYWFEQRGRQSTNDFEVKFLSMWDTITVGRSDGGLVRLITPIGRSEGVEQAEARLGSFLTELLPELPAYFPAL